MTRWSFLSVSVLRTFSGLIVCMTMAASTAHSIALLDFPLIKHASGSALDPADRPCSTDSASPLSPLVSPINPKPTPSASGQGRAQNLRTSLDFRLPPVRRQLCRRRGNFKPTNMRQISRPRPLPSHSHRPPPETQWLFHLASINNNTRRSTAKKSPVAR